MNVLRYCSLFVCCLLLARPLMAQEGIKGNLVNVQWLEKNLKNADVVILDASSPKTYATQHISGALNVDIYAYGIQEMPAAATQQLYQSWGVSSGKRIIIYDEGASMNATSIFFAIYYDGFPVKNLFILDGGLSKWQEVGLPVTNEPSSPPKKGTFTITKVKEDARVRLPEVLNASGDPEKNALVEALGANWHFGELQVFDRPGHIPNGILLPSTDFYNSDKTFKSPEEIEKMLNYVGVTPDQQIITYCGGGVAACVPFFAIKFVLNYPKVKLYKESEMGWLKDERRLPYWTYDAPSLTRETNWLQIWGGQMLRMYGGAKISVVDVRPADAYNQGHLPFSLNIPAEAFKSNVNNPDKLAEILGPAGVDASHEAVVISGAGLTKESALAFVLLERLGQKKVSVFMDSIGQWTRPNFAVTKEATVVGTKKSPMDLSIPPTKYSGKFRKDVIVTDPKSTQGLYPKVFIASGKEAPAKVPDGKVVHVQYTDLLNADGTPKAAKDIWNILAKAGVPRYAELVCFSDDPGEAAVNYFILKLMGYPDIKVMI